MGQRLLLVDSDRSFLKEHQVSLEAAFDLEVANSPDSVVARLERGGYAAVLISVEVADNKGYALCSTLRKQPGLDDLKIALISAKATKEEYRRHQSLKGKADLYLHKPIAPSALVAALEPLVPGRVLDPDNPLGDLADTELGGDWLDAFKGAGEVPAPKAAPVAPAPTPTPKVDPLPARSTRPPTTTHAHLLEEQIVALREELRVKDQQLREAEGYLHEQIGSTTLNLDEVAAARQEAGDAKDKAQRLQLEQAGLEATIRGQGRDLVELGGQLKQLEAKLKTSEARVLEQEQELQLREKKIAQLTAQVQQDTLQHDAERLEMMTALDQKEVQLSDYRDRLKSLDTLLQEIQERLKRGSDLARG